MAAIRIFQWFASLCILGILPPLVSGCLFPPGVKVPERLNLAAMFSRAPYVVHATGVGKNETENLAIMEVHCVFKPNMTLATTPFPETIYVHYFIFGHSCMENPDYKVGVGYVMALESYSGYPIDGFDQGAIFDNYKPRWLQQNIYQGTPSVVQDTLRVCGVAPSGVGNSTCPESPGLSPDDCGPTTSSKLTDMTTSSTASDMTTSPAVSDMTTSLTASLTAVAVVSCVVLAMVEG